MKNWLYFCAFSLVSTVFSGCSTQQYFTLVNATDETISIKYSLDNPSGDDAIFTLPSEIFQANASYEADPEHQLPYNDLDFSDNNVHLKLPPKSVLVIARIFNDPYNSATQSTVQGKKFNLKQLTFSYGGNDFTIDNGNFHDFFIEKEGTFRYIVQ
jgi:hypothetical protein